MARATRIYIIQTRDRWVQRAFTVKYEAKNFLRSVDVSIIDDLEVVSLPDGVWQPKSTLKRESPQEFIDGR